MAPETHKGQFGPAVIGEQAYEDEQEEVVTEQRDTFGEAVVGGSNMTSDTPDTSASPEEESDPFPDGYHVEMSGGYGVLTDPDGERVTLGADTQNDKYHGRESAREAAWEHARQEEASQGEAEEAAEESADDLTDATIEEAEQALAENPALVDRFLRTEIQRPDGIRPEVIDAMEAAESSKDEPREEVFETLESLRAELGGSDSGEEE